MIIPIKRRKRQKFLYRILHVKFSVTIVTVVLKQQFLLHKYKE